MEELEEIQKRVIRHPDAVDLYIKRMPSKTRELFVNFANEHFCGDYGMCLQSVLNQFLVICPQIETMMQVLDDLIQRVEALENGKVESTPKESKIKTLKRKEEKKDVKISQITS